MSLVSLQRNTNRNLHHQEPQVPHIFKIRTAIARGALARERRTTRFALYSPLSIPSASPTRNNQLDCACIPHTPLRTHQTPQAASQNLGMISPQASPQTTPFKTSNSKNKRASTQPRPRHKISQNLSSRVKDLPNNTCQSWRFGLLARWIDGWMDGWIAGYLLDRWLVSLVAGCRKNTRISELAARNN